MILTDKSLLLLKYHLLVSKGLIPTRLPLNDSQILRFTVAGNANTLQACSIEFCKWFHEKWTLGGSSVCSSGKGRGFLSASHKSYQKYFH